MHSYHKDLLFVSYIDILVLITEQLSSFIDVYCYCYIIVTFVTLLHIVTLLLLFIITVLMLGQLYLLVNRRLTHQEMMSLAKDTLAAALMMSSILTILP